MSFIRLIPVARSTRKSRARETSALPLHGGESRQPHWRAETAPRMSGSELGSRPKKNERSGVAQRSARSIGRRIWITSAESQIYSPHSPMYRLWPADFASELATRRALALYLRCRWMRPRDACDRTPIVMPPSMMICAFGLALIDQHVRGTTSLLRASRAGARCRACLTVYSAPV